jgi:phosphoglycolate phosphatase-like HAD superfamily hydrolase
MVGDSPNDVRAGRALGAITVAVGYGLTPTETLCRAEPDHFVDSVAELADLLLAT